MSNRYVTAILACLTFVFAAPGLADERPNIIVILADDMGFSDLGCYGSEIPTPNIDALAENGLKFTQFYNTGRCCPTRAALLTGLYSHQTGVGHMTDDLDEPGYRGYLNHHCLTFGDIASRAGYFTAISGKWHVGAKDHSMWPYARGFDRSYSVPQGGGFYFQVRPRRTIVLDDHVVADQQHPLPDGFYTTDAWTEYGLKFIDEAIEHKQPFLLYLAHNAPHFPLQAPAEDIDLFRGKYKQGWDVLSEERYKRQIAMGLIDESWQKTERPADVAAWDSLRKRRRDRFDHLMATYAACVYHLDKSVGDLVAGLKERGQFDNTLILFMSDNGGNAESGPRGKTQGDPTQPESKWFCGKSWAWMENTPFRKFKHHSHEGGVATPLIAHWPRGIQAQGEWQRQPAHVIDIMATIVDLVQGDYPTEVDGVPITPLEGKSLRPLFGDGTLERDALYWEHEGNAAVRVGDWKLVRFGGQGAWELYNMKADRTETHDLAADQPDKARELKDKWLRWAERCHVAPAGLPKKPAGQAS